MAEPLMLFMAEKRPKQQSKQKTTTLKTKKPRNHENIKEKRSNNLAKSVATQGIESNSFRLRGTSRMDSYFNKAPELSKKRNGPQPNSATKRRTFLKRHAHAKTERTHSETTYIGPRKARNAQNSPIIIPP